MRLLPVPLICTALLLAACGGTAAPGGGGEPAAETPGPDVSAAPGEAPRPEGEVTGVGTVLQLAGGTPELCLGPVRESFPPQCEGVPLSGWDWAVAGVQEQVATGAAVTRWGTYAVTGGFDGFILTVTSSVPLALYDVAAPPSPRPVAPPRLSEQQWSQVEDAARRLPGVLTVVREPATGPVHVTVVYDDGSLQADAAAAFGAGAVLVTSALR